MVESSDQGDGLVRNLIYAKWRTDIKAEKGYSRELVSVNLKPEYYDNIENNPGYSPDCKTFLDYFERTVKTRGDDQYLGTRVKLNEKELGDYEWKSYKEVQNIA